MRQKASQFRNYQFIALNLIIYRPTFIVYNACITVE